MRELQFEILGVPQQKRSATPFSTRPKDGSNPRTFMVPNKKNNPVEHNIQNLVVQAGWVPGTAPHLGPVYLTTTFFFTVPTSTPKWKRDLMLHQSSDYNYMIKKPDVDRLNNMLQDALQGIVFRDDCQVSYGPCHKRYSEYPHTVVRIELLDGVPDKKPMGVK